MKSKPYPRKCFNCLEQAVSQAFEDTAVELQHDGRPLTVRVPGLEVETCAACGNRTWSHDSARRVEDALWVASGILMPAEILAARLRLACSQAELAAIFDVSESEYARWESGDQLQSTATDKLLRLYFANPDSFRHNVAWPHVTAGASTVP